MKLRFASSVLLLSLAVLFTAALRGRRSTQHVAELLSVTGVVQRQPDSNQRWSAAAAGARFSYGSALRTLAASTAMVRMQAGGGLLVRPNTTIRFRRTRLPATSIGVRVDQGEIELTSGAPAAIELDGVDLRLSANSRVRARVEPDGLRVFVQIGSAIIERTGEPQEWLWTGTEKLFARLIENFSPFVRSTRPDLSARDRAAAPNRPNGDSTTRDAGATDATAPMSTALPSTASSAESRARFLTTEPADVVLRAGQSARLHVPEPPARVRFESPTQCHSSPTRILLSGRTIRSTLEFGDAAALSLPAGAYSYALECRSGAVIRRGVLTVDSSTGEAPLPTSAPTSDVSCNGRRYVVYYQNRLPAVRVRWDGLRGDGRLVLRLEGGSMRSIEFSGGVATLESGQLPEGVHHVAIESLDRRARSDDTAVHVVFDNAAPSVQIRSPSAAGFVAGLVSVVGFASPGSTVSVGNTPLPLDAQRRFSASIQASSSLAIAIRHRTRGNHYFVRRVRP